jgi:hypothetical protein
MTDDPLEEASISLEVDSAQLDLSVRLRFRSVFEFWIAEVTLPGWTTPRARVSLTGLGNDRQAALNDLLRTVSDAVARYEPARKAGRRSRR